MTDNELKRKAIGIALRKVFYHYLNNGMKRKVIHDGDATISSQICRLFSGDVHSFSMTTLFEMMNNIEQNSDKTSQEIFKDIWNQYKIEEIIVMNKEVDERTTT